MGHKVHPNGFRLGVSRSLALAHFPGLLHAHLRQSDPVKVIVEHLSGSELIPRLEAGHLDLAVFCPPGRLPSSVTVTHRMEDVFHLIAPAGERPPSLSPGSGRWSIKVRAWLSTRPWILPGSAGQTGQRMRRWLTAQGVEAAPAMELDDFDLIVQLVSLKMGIALVPRRTLSGFPRKHLLQRIPLPEEFQRELAVIMPRLTRTPEHIADFVDRILFS